MDEKKHLSEKASMLTIPKDEIIYFPGDSSRYLYFLKVGRVKLSRYSEDGREVIMRILGPGEIFGELSLADQGTRDEIAQVIEDAVICYIDIPNLERMLMRNPVFNLQITKWIGLTLRKVESNLESLCFKNNAQRIRGFLKNLADQHGQKQGTDEIEVKLNLTHEDIAKLTFTSRQNVSSVMSELEKQNIISYNRKRIVVKRYESL